MPAFLTHKQLRFLATASVLAREQDRTRSILADFLSVHPASQLKNFPFQAIPNERWPARFTQGQWFAVAFVGYLLADRSQFVM